MHPSGYHKQGVSHGSCHITYGAETVQKLAGFKGLGGLGGAAAVGGMTHIRFMLFVEVAVVFVRMSNLRFRSCKKYKRSLAIPSGRTIRLTKPYLGTSAG